MEDRVWTALHQKHGVDRDDRTSWRIPLSAGLQSLRDLKVFGPTKRFADQAGRVGDIPASVVELSGDPGDVVIGHPWLLHSPWPNYGERPRLMRVQRIVSKG